MLVNKRQARASWISRLTEEERNLVYSHMSERVYTAGESIYKVGEPPNGIHEIRSGRVRITEIDASGNENIHTVLSAPMTFGEVTLLSNTRYHLSGTAVENSLIGFLPRQKWIELTKTHTNIAFSILKSVAWRYSILLDINIARNQSNLESRLAARIFYLAKSQADKVDSDTGAHFSLKLTQEDLASLLTSSRQSINKILKCWQDKGIVQLKYGEIVVCDLNLVYDMMPACTH